MFPCIICRFEHELDDVAVMASTGDQCICVRCFVRETDSAKPMPKELRRQLTAVLTEIDIAV
jgi:hypothetical protein